MNDEIRAIVDKYPEEFEANFAVVGGVLQKCDNNTQSWYNRHLDFIHLYIGFRPPALCLQDPLPTREVQITAAYTYAYIAYRKVCSLRSRDPLMDASFHSLCPPDTPMLARY